MVAGRRVARIVVATGTGTGTGTGTATATAIVTATEIAVVAVVAVAVVAVPIQSGQGTGPVQNVPRTVSLSRLSATSAAQLDPMSPKKGTLQTSYGAGVMYSQGPVCSAAAH